MKPNVKAATLVLVLTASACLLSCGGGGQDDIHSNAPQPDTNPGLPATVSVAPVSTGDGWPVSTPLAENLDSAGVLATLESIRNGNSPGVDSLVVVRAKDPSRDGV